MPYSSELAMLRSMASANGAKAVTPDDDADLPDGIAEALFVVETGNVELMTADGDTLTLTSVAAHVRLPFRTKRVMEDTTATVVALY